jgi:hypothetical protein
MSKHNLFNNLYFLMFVKNKGKKHDFSTNVVEHRLLCDISHKQRWPALLLAFDVKLHGFIHGLVHIGNSVFRLGMG